MGAQKRRIDQAWRLSKDWIAEFDGSARQAYLTNVNVDGLPGAINSLANETGGLRVSTISAGDGEGGDQPVHGEFVSPETIRDQVSRLQRDEIDGLNVDFSVRLKELDFDLHVVVVTMGKQKVDLEMVWWPDQVFLDNSDHALAFEALLGYFISLQERLKASKLYIGPETFERPGPGSQDWVEV
jgi:hypothetical protein